ncbi:hypothetical protein HYV10_00520 [Candidatus Dependentiae bacterium]|nr:hypothetical protein [Candidatus Dependentiae bacterium]
MFTKKFSLETAYYSGGKTVMNYFMFFLFAIIVGSLTGGLFLMVLGLVDFALLKDNFMELVRLFEQATTSVTGPVHHQALSVHGALRSFIPENYLQQLMNMDPASIDIAREEMQHILKWIIPSALIFKLFLDMISIGWVKVALDLNANKQVSLRYLFEYYYLVPRVFTANLIVGILTIAGSLLFLLPGLFIYQRLRFARFFIIDKNLSIVKALQASWSATESSVFHLTGFTIISLILDRFSDFFFIFKAFVIPLQNQTETNVYQQLAK